MAFANFMDLFLSFSTFIECSGFLSPPSSRAVPFIFLAVLTNLSCTYPHE